MSLTKSILTLAAVLLSVLVFPNRAQAGTTIDSTMTWQGVTRYYEVYLPTNLPAKPPMLLMLHPTSYNPATSPPITSNYGWKTLSDQNGFILVKPASTYYPKTGQWNWNAYYLDGAFPPPPPDDSGFLRQLITNLTAQYNVDAKRIFVAGFSSGAMMTQRVGVEISDLVAAIAPAAGPIVGQHVPPIVLPGSPVEAVSVQEWHGTLDKALQPCNNGTTKYSGYTVTLATVDQSFNYWVQQNSCTQLQTTQPLCVSGQPNPAVPSNDATGCVNNVEVQFIWEQGIAHIFASQYNAARWQFFASHPKP